MADSAIVTPCPVFCNGVQIGDATEGDYTVNSGQGQVITDQGVGVTKGRVTVTMSVKTVVPRRGMKYRMFEDAINQKKLTIMIPIDSKFHTFDGFLETVSGNWNFANGTCTGDAKFMGASPTVT